MHIPAATHHSVNQKDKAYILCNLYLTSVIGTALYLNLYITYRQGAGKV